MFSPLSAVSCKLLYSSRINPAESTRNARLAGIYAAATPINAISTTHHPAPHGYQTAPAPPTVLTFLSGI